MANFARGRELPFQQTDADENRAGRTGGRDMLLWIAYAGAALGLYALSLAPFIAVPIAADRPKRREVDDD